MLVGLGEFKEMELQGSLCRRSRAFKNWMAASLYLALALNRFSAFEISDFLHFWIAATSCQ